MREKEKYNGVRSSERIWLVLQGLSFLVILAYIILYANELDGFGIEAFHSSFYIHLALLAWLIISFVISFKYSLVAGIGYIVWYILLITIGRVEDMNQAILTMMYFGFVLGVPIVILGISLIINREVVRKSKWD